MKLDLETLKHIKGTFDIHNDLTRNQGYSSLCALIKQEEDKLVLEKDNAAPQEDIKETILKEYAKGNIVVATFEGIQAMPLKEFIKQPVDGMLYDLNRNEAVVLTFINDPKWINDYAVVKVIRELKGQIEEKEKSGMEC